MEDKKETTPEATPATEQVVTPATEESKEKDVDAPVQEAVASEVETQPAQPVSLIWDLTFFVYFKDMQL